MVWSWVLGGLVCVSSGARLPERWCTSLLQCDAATSRQCCSGREGRAAVKQPRPLQGRISAWRTAAGDAPWGATTMRATTLAGVTWSSRACTRDPSMTTTALPPSTCAGPAHSSRCTPATPLADHLLRLRPARPLATPCLPRPSRHRQAKQAANRARLFHPAPPVAAASRPHLRQPRPMQHRPQGTTFRESRSPGAERTCGTATRCRRPSRS
jgi:hypothetical protein